MKTIAPTTHAPSAQSRHVAEVGSTVEMELVRSSGASNSHKLVEKTTDCQEAFPQEENGPGTNIHSETKSSQHRGIEKLQPQIVSTCFTKGYQNWQATSHARNQQSPLLCEAHAAESLDCSSIAASKF